MWDGTGGPVRSLRVVEGSSGESSLPLLHLSVPSHPRNEDTKAGIGGAPRGRQTDPSQTRRCEYLAHWNPSPTQNLKGSIPLL